MSSDSLPELLEKATSDWLIHPDYRINLQIVNFIHTSPEACDLILLHISSRLQYNYSKQIQLLTLHLLESCIQADYVMLEYINRESFQQCIRELVERPETHYTVKDKALNLVRAWAEPLERSREFPNFWRTYQYFRGKSIGFPAKNANCPPFIPPTRREEIAGASLRSQRSQGSPSLAGARGPDPAITEASYHLHSLESVLESIDPPDTVEFSDIYRELMPIIEKAHIRTTRILGGSAVGSLDEATLGQLLTFNDEVMQLNEYLEEMRNGRIPIALLQRLRPLSPTVDESTTRDASVPPLQLGASSSSGSNRKRTSSVKMESEAIFDDTDVEEVAVALPEPPRSFRRRTRSQKEIKQVASRIMGEIKMSEVRDVDPEPVDPTEGKIAIHMQSFSSPRDRDIYENASPASAVAAADASSPSDFALPSPPRATRRRTQSQKSSIGQISRDSSFQSAPQPMPRTAVTPRGDKRAIAEEDPFALLCGDASSAAVPTKSAPVHQEDFFAAFDQQKATSTASAPSAPTTQCDPGDPFQMMAMNSSAAPAAPVAPAAVGSKTTEEMDFFSGSSASAELPVATGVSFASPYAQPHMQYETNQLMNPHVQQVSMLGMYGYASPQQGGMQQQQQSILQQQQHVHPQQYNYQPQQPQYQQQQQQQYQQQHQQQQQYQQQQQQQQQQRGGRPGGFV